MIAKCIAILAVVAQINASICGCGSSSVVLAPAGSGLASGAVSKNIVASGKFPVALSNCGPVSSAQIPITTSQVTAPVQEKPIVRLPAQIPAPRTIAHSCTCYKTIVRPRVHQQIITVPSVQRYVETLHKPVVENVQYEALPVNCGGVSSSVSGLISVGSGSVCGSPIQAIQVPSFSAPVVQSVQAPIVQSLPAPVVQSVQVPVVQSAPAPCFQQVEIPQTISLGCASPCSC